MQFIFFRINETRNFKVIQEVLSCCNCNDSKSMISEWMTSDIGFVHFDIRVALNYIGY
jgi:hypothetical protein